MIKNKKELEYQRFLKDLKEVIASNKSLFSLGDLPDVNDCEEKDLDVAEQSVLKEEKNEPKAPDDSLPSL